MASEQENRIVAEVMDNMKMAETEESSARRYVRRAVDKILIYCCREDLPERLEGTAAQIAEDMLKADLLVSTGKETSSVTRGDTTISYRDPSASRSATVDFMKNYETSVRWRTGSAAQEPRLQALEAADQETLERMRLETTTGVVDLLG